MKRYTVFFLVICLCLPLISCSKEDPKPPATDDGVEDILFLGDDLMETSKVYEYFEELCRINGRNVRISYRTVEDARMYTYAEMCTKDKEFRALVESADVLLFQEGSAETVTTVKSVTDILSYSNDPTVVCISYYGYPRWMHRNLFIKSHPEFRYADSNTVIGSIIALDYPPLGFEHLYHEDYIHPNELNGFVVSLLCYAKAFDLEPADIAWDGLEHRENIIVGSPCKDRTELKELMADLVQKTDKYMN